MRLEVRFNGFRSPYKQIRVEFSADDSEETVRMSIIAAAATALSGRTMRATCDTRAKLYTACKLFNSTAHSLLLRVLDSCC